MFVRTIKISLAFLLLIVPVCLHFYAIQSRQDEFFISPACPRPVHLPLAFSRAERRPWAITGDDRCSSFSTRFVKPGPRPRVALATYPGSGNTWTRHLLEGLTGVFTGDVYRGVHLNHVFIGTKERDTANTTFLVKTHYTVRGKLLCVKYETFAWRKFPLACFIFWKYILGCANVVRNK